MTLYFADRLHQSCTGRGNRPALQQSRYSRMHKHVVDIGYGEKTDIAPDIKISMENAGHILGSSSVYMQIGEVLTNIDYCSLAI